MLIDLVTIFPEACQGYLDSSIVGRARRRGLIQVELVDPRRWAGGRHRTVDDRPYGGGPGMVLAAPPLAGAIDWCLTRSARPRLLLTDARGRRLDHPWVRELAACPHLIIVCGHYEGIDERIAELYHPERVSLGEFVLSGGELVALAIVDAVARLQPGALGCAESALQESFADGLTYDHPCYTRPEEFRELRVPEPLLSGDHAAIAAWRAAQRRRIGGER
ncbi:MAG: tRNA (guanosine(37)-N1)-methyltransferase TrmD [Planctomycetota bacterium]|nr:tRNA (guanosine(37)-N1)-methyltransferase TrmD [Planctomycetota bacterium]MCX8039291.1 tRNA (guanosine(37)-N1)-methyltransferase TrmD [Planctomycetota bacterium]MDW8372056.1 tRNA (guanosine(37)-N1)-methyltransferase TrmD [Planctomycetota bacterium]